MVTDGTEHTKTSQNTIRESSNTITLSQVAATSGESTTSAEQNLFPQPTIVQA